jgi:hypothetical protein
MVWPSFAVACWALNVSSERQKVEYDFGILVRDTLFMSGVVGELESG